MSVLCHHPKGGLEMMVHLVYVLVDAAVMQQLVHKEVPRVLDHQAAKELCQNHIPIVSENSDPVIYVYVLYRWR